MKLTKYGLKEWLGTAVLALILVVVAFFLVRFELIGLNTAIFLSVFIILIWVTLAAFFRDPERDIPASPVSLVSPADGVVRDIELLKVENCPSEELKKLFDGRDILRIGIFLSVFDVHVNRAPSNMKVSFKHYKKGRFHDARDARASRDNESMMIGGTGEVDGIQFPIAVRQISGAIARRIVCPVESGDELKKGERYGMIKFGSRAEIYLLAGKYFDVQVKVGDRVNAGSTVIANILPVAREKSLIPSETGEDTAEVTP